MFLRDFDNLVREGEPVGVYDFPVATYFVCYVVHDGNGYDRLGEGASNAAPGVTKLEGVPVLPNVGVCGGRE